LASASVIALLVAVGLRARQGTFDDRRRARTVLLGVAALVVGVGVIAFIWTLTRPA
jgi:hypothetical protein